LVKLEDQTANAHHNGTFVVSAQDESIN